MKTLLVTIANNPFLPAAQVMIKSFLIHNSWFDGSIRILHSNKLSPLSEDSMKKISEVDSRIEFFPVNENRYSSIDMSSALNERFRVSYFTLEAFKFSGYDRVLFIDADILVLGDLKSLVERDIFTGTSNSLNLYTKNRDCGPGKETPLYINGGVFSIPGKEAGPELFQQLMDIAKPGWPKCDQDTINEWLKRTNKVYYAITNKFNCMVRAASQRFKSMDDLTKDGVRILHYAGKFKPWLLDPSSPFLQLEKPWIDFYHENFGKLQNE